MTVPLARENGLTQEAWQPMPTVLAGSQIGDQRRHHLGQAKGVIQFSVQ